LLDYASLKLLAMRVGATTIERKRDLVSVKFRQNALIDPERLAKFVASHGSAKFSPDGVLKFTSKAVRPDEVLLQLQNLLEDLSPAELSSPISS
jgi:transcription-repair coupling factor (superfamily II helicase)